MLLYHFTASEYLDSIMAEGLTRGEVPLSATNFMNAVNLTSSPDSAGHGLSDSREFTPEERDWARRMNDGRLPDGPLRFLNKKAVRITVKIPRDDRNLVAWPKWARKHLAADWYATLNKAAGGKANTWFLYWGVIPPTWFVKVEKRRETGEWSGYGRAGNRP